MLNPTRRTLLAGAVALGATAASAQEQPVEGKRGAPILGPHNAAREAQNPDILRPPETDSGGIPNLHFAFADAHVKMREGGWSREVTQREMPIATTIAGVNMRLTAGGVRELHWHKPDEWAFMLAGKARITAIDKDGHNFVDDVGPGDLWYFPSGIPHSIQGLSPEGTEFLLAFTDGGFSEDSTFAITDMFAHFPPEVLAKNFMVDKKVFDDIPKHEKFIFPAAEPPSLEQDRIQSPAGPLPRDRNMSFRLMQMQPTQAPGGTVRIADSSNFPISTNLAAALVEVQPGHLREIHWHPNADEWQYYISGKARMTVFAAQGAARTFDYLAGDVGYVPLSMPHYVENTGSDPLRFLELFRAPHFEDISLAQWMALTPRNLVTAHLNLDRQFLDNISKNKQPVV
ncbi:oxalate decarboxylase family bicupin [Bradyrhizobium sp. Leo170]|uniref:oxalate decarboxylase family bicupin n=1 Tax=Bradyrhizobium sp. Leo170 TaxID=1571199 RepID=UPI00102E7260|nr:oxalate decarboxylase family bicupin [Bradyrhizobium sp. Leo170]TAI65529.1 oxalate decarboxylase [Bradyrhizobium sp. Leo170]